MHITFAHLRGILKDKSYFCVLYGTWFFGPATIPFGDGVSFGYGDQYTGDGRGGIDDCEDNQLICTGIFSIEPEEE